MIKKYTVLAMLAGLILLGTGCTENGRTKVFGGKMTVNLPTNTKLVNATWKEADLWYLTRPMHSNEVAETYSFKEKSRFGMVQGEVVLIESK